jgi:peptide/nickel transport system substrate-binding protein
MFELNRVFSSPSGLLCLNITKIARAPAGSRGRRQLAPSALSTGRGTGITYWTAGTATLLLLLFFSTSSGSGNTLRYANQGDWRSLDPYTLNETTTNAHLAHVYEGLTLRDKDLSVKPGLAERWEISESGLRWRFFLRKGVRFHDGSAFTADDVVFSAARVRAPGSNFRVRVPLDAEVIKVDDHTVDVVLKRPNPILISDWHTWFIMSRTWSGLHNAMMPTPASGSTASYAALNANGTGPFRIVSHEPGVRTVLAVNSHWWGQPEHNLTQIIFTPIAAPATRVAALLSGAIDVIEPVPLQDIERVNASAGARVISGAELRAIFLGFDQIRDELLYSSVKGKNPFKDKRVRQAFAYAIDVDAIKSRIMRGLSRPSPLLIAREAFTHWNSFARTPFGADKARRLLVEAGYPDGFELGMDCPNDRYVNDAEICSAVAAMLARVGVKVNLNIQPKARYFAKALQAGGYQISFYLLGWGSIDAYAVLNEIYGCRNEAGPPRGYANLGGYCNPRVDELADRILVETDMAKRDHMIKEAFEITTGDVAYIPLHQQPYAWGVSRRIDLVPRADNAILFYWARVN